MCCPTLQPAETTGTVHLMAPDYRFNAQSLAHKTTSYINGLIHAVGNVKTQLSYHVTSGCSCAVN